MTTDSLDTDERSDEHHAELLASIVQVARSCFAAAASSVFLLDKERAELVFEATAGRGEGALPGVRFPADRGIAGWVAASGQPMVVADLSTNVLFAREVAERTGYVPSAIMAVPVAYRGEILGVLEVIDPHPESRSSLSDLEVLTMLATQAGISLHSVSAARAERRSMRDGGRYARLLDLMDVLSAASPSRAQAGWRVIDALCEILGPDDH